MRHFSPTNAECFCALAPIRRATRNNALVFEMRERNLLDPARLGVNPDRSGARFAAIWG
jgi:hypothetical protein